MQEKGNNPITAIKVNWITLETMNKEIIHHYNSLIDENNDPVQDPLPLQKYMDKWDGQAFIDDNIAKALLLSPIGGSVA